MIDCMVKEETGLCSEATGNCGNSFSVPYFVSFVILGAERSEKSSEQSAYAMPQSSEQSVSMYLVRRWESSYVGSACL